jgi:hypothetical protein
MFVRLKKYDSTATVHSARVAKKTVRGKLSTNWSYHMKMANLAIALAMAACLGCVNVLQAQITAKTMPVYNSAPRPFYLVEGMMQANSRKNCSSAPAVPFLAATSRLPIAARPCSSPSTLMYRTAPEQVWAPVSSSAT